VLGPLGTILELSIGPAKLIQKRNDKLLDYESLLSKAEKNKDLRVQLLLYCYLVKRINFIDAGGVELG
jgi:hypothetical protein